MWKKILPLLLLASIAGSCAWPSWLYFKHPPIDIPPRPKLAACPEKPVIDADIVGDTIVTKRVDADRLHQWTLDVQVCYRSHEAELTGQIEKLENRLKAIR